MKKRLLAVFLALICLFSMSACGVLPFLGPTNAGALIGKITSAMGALRSYEYQTAVTLQYFVNGDEVSETRTENGIEMAGNGTNYYSYLKTETERMAANTTPVQKLSLMAYNDGKMFLLRDTDGNVPQKLFSQMGKKEFLDYRSQIGRDIEAYFMNCSEQSFEKTKNKGWRLMLSGYSKEAVDKIKVAYELDPDVIGASVSDLSVVITTDSKYHLQEIKIQTLFDQKSMEDAEKTYSAQVSIQYAKYNEAQRVTEGIDPEEYHEVGDLRSIGTAARLFDVRQEAEEGSFTLWSEATCEYMMDNNIHISQTLKRQTVRYGTDAGGFFYEMDHTEDLVQNTQHSVVEQVTVSYHQGREVITVNGKDCGTVDVPVKDAKKVVRDMFSAFEYDPDVLQDEHEQEEGVYVFRQENMPEDSFSHWCETNDSRFQSASRLVTVTIRDDRLVKIESVIALIYHRNHDSEQIGQMTWRASLTFHE